MGCHLSISQIYPFVLRLLLFRVVVGYVLSGSECFWDPDRCGHRELQVACVPRYWELALRNGDGLVVGAQRVQRREENRVFTGICLTPWDWDID